MMSMGSLAHYMHDLSRARLHIQDFLQEGNEQLWVHAATRGPRGFVKWIVIEERAEGGDVLFQAASATRASSRASSASLRVAASRSIARS